MCHRDTLLSGRTAALKILRTCQCTVDVQTQAWSWVPALSIFQKKKWFPMFLPVIIAVSMIQSNGDTSTLNFTRWIVTPIEFGPEFRNIFHQRRQIFKIGPTWNFDFWFSNSSSLCFFDWASNVVADGSVFSCQRTVSRNRLHLQHSLSLRIQRP